MRRRKTFAPAKTTFFLNINSLVDMFTILLVFLLQSYSTAEVQLNPVEGLRLPQSDSMQNPAQALKISLSQEELKVGDRVVAKLREARFADGEADSKDPQFLPGLFNELESISKESTDKHIKEGQMLLQADARLPYDTLRKVLYTASMAGFPQLKLVTLVGN